MRIIHTIASTQSDHGGTSHSVPALCDALLDEGVDCYLIAGVAVKQIGAIWPKDESRIRRIPESRWIRQWGVGKAMQRQLHQLTSSSDAPCIVHDHGIWLASNHAVARWSYKSGTKRLVSPRGMLGTWAMNQGASKKRLAWAGYQRADLARASGFHATAQQEADELRACGFEQAIHVIPNGVAMPPAGKVRSEKSTKKALLLSRLHPKKGVIELIDAWSRIDRQDWSLSIVGPADASYRDDIRSRIQRHRLGGSVALTDEARGDEKWDHYAGADLFVLPSYNENFGIVIAEAMSMGLPVMTTQSTPWSALEELDAGWWIETGTGALVPALQQAIATNPERLRAMGARAKAHVEAHFSWPGLAKRYISMYEDLLHAPPVAE